MTFNAYEQYFAAEAADRAGKTRHGANVMLTVTSEGGHVTYLAAVTFFPHEDETDYSVTYDMYFEEVIYDAPGRRSKKREKEFMGVLRDKIDAQASAAGGKVFWDRPLRPARFG